MRCSGSSALCIRWICFSPLYGMCMRTRPERLESACRSAQQGRVCFAVFCVTGARRRCSVRACSSLDCRSNAPSSKVRRARVEWIVSISPIEVDRIGEPWSRSRGRLAPAASCPRAHSHWVFLCHGPPRSASRLPTVCACGRGMRDRSRLVGALSKGGCVLRCFSWRARGGGGAVSSSFSTYKETLTSSRQGRRARG